MHRALEIPEILDYIMEYLTTYRYGDIPSLARVNKALSERALDFICKDIGSLSLLLYCFPEDLLDMKVDDGPGQTMVRCYSYLISIIDCFLYICQVFQQAID